ncbi:MAG: prepilin-type N-terminal cleavage/methylation domain-containing protein [Desulfobacterales bacterium]|nr:MAG: prepilin-type N-terminal cleavage/methylation domain-containing protein [Desulfobacterales bacterium]
MSEKGFTLVEILVAIFASLIVLGAIAATFIIQDKSYDREDQIVDMQENVRAAMQILTAKLRMTGYDPTGSTGAGLVAADSDSIQFTMDLNGDGDILDTNPDEDITFALDTTDLQLTMDGQPVAENIPANGLVLTYFDSNDNQLTTPLSAGDLAAVTRITIQLTARTQKPDPDYPGGYRTRTLTSDVVVPNLAISAATTTATTTVGTTTEGTTTVGTTTEETTTSETTTSETTTSETTTSATTTAETTTTEPGTTTTTTTEPVDSEGPTIANIVQSPPGGQIMNNRDVAVCADITDVSGLGFALLYTDRDDPITMTAEGGDTYCGVIPSHNNQFTTYYILAQDTLTNETQSASFTYEQGPHF